MPSLYYVHSSKWLAFVQQIFSYTTEHCLRKGGRLCMNYPSRKRAAGSVPRQTLFKSSTLGDGR